MGHRWGIPASNPSLARERDENEENKTLDARINKEKNNIKKKKGRLKKLRSLPRKKSSASFLFYFRRVVGMVHAHKD